MITWAIIMSFMIKYLSPIKMSFSVLITSLGCSAWIYSQLASTYPPICILISFSSGLMILFSYCSINTKYENSYQKSKMKEMFLILMAFYFISIQHPYYNSNNLSKEIIPLFSSPLILMSMSVVMLSLIAINKSINKSKKSISNSY